MLQSTVKESLNNNEASKLDAKILLGRENNTDFTSGLVVGRSWNRKKFIREGIEEKIVQGEMTGIWSIWVMKWKISTL